MLGEFPRRGQSLWQNLKSSSGEGLDQKYFLKRSASVLFYTDEGAERLSHSRKMQAWALFE
jgi:hypothetical protein